MQKVIILKGLPASGKTTWAKEMIDKDHSYKRISMDDLRDMIDNGYWNGAKTENLIRRCRNELVRSILIDGYNLIVDATNLDPKHEETIKEIIKDLEIYPEKHFNIKLEIKMFDTPITDCIERDAKRAKPVGEKVILDMYNRYLKKEVVPPEYNDELPDAIICDIDGTLAKNNGDRGFYEWHKVGLDKINKPIKGLIEKFKNEQIIIVSGRDGICNAETADWLSRHKIKYDKLLMRQVGDNRKDSIIKKELYDAFIKDKYNVLFVLDDRNQTVEMWRSLGLTCLQVDYGDF